MEIPRDETGRLTGIQAAARTLRALEIIALAAQPVLLKEVASALGVSEAAALRLVRTMISCGFVAEAPNDEPGYVPTLRVAELASQVLTRSSVRSVAVEEMVGVAEQFGESITIALPDGDSIVFIERIIYGPAVEFFCDVGRRLPLHVGAAARAILAWIPQEQFDRYVDQPLKAYTPHTRVSRDELASDRERVRREGFAVSKGDVEIGISAVAVPFFNSRGEAIGAASIANVSERWDEASYVSRGRAMVGAAQRVSARCHFVSQGIRSRDWSS